MTSPPTPIENNTELVVVHNEMVMADHEILPDAMMLNNEIVPMEMQDNTLETPKMPPKKVRKKKSMVWEFFTIESVGDGCRRACCKQCKQSFAYSQGCKVAGTSHLKRHIAKGTCAAVLRNQQLLNNNNNNLLFSAPAKMRGYRGGNAASGLPKKRYRTATTPFITFDLDRCRQEISRMTIMHDYPLHMVEHPGFIAFVQTLQPRFDMLSFNTVQGDCLATYLREKQAVQRMIEGMPGRICLTLDVWSSHLRVGYVFISGQFIDSEWKVHRKVLNVVREPFPDSDTAFSHAIAVCLSDWGIEGKLFSVTINQPLPNQAVDNLRALLSVKNPVILGGQLLVGNCLAHTLSSIAVDALSFAQDSVKKVRDSVKYVKTSESNEEKFLELKQHLQVPSAKNLSLDDQTRWNTTFEMLAVALELKEVFSCLDTSVLDYSGGPTTEDWKRIETLHNYLKILFDTSNLLSGPTTPTTNAFFHEVWKIQLELARAAVSKDPFVSGLTKLMQERFNKYWNSCCLILSIAVIVDPRFKMKLVEFSFSKIYGEDATSYVKVVDDGIHELFQDYVDPNGGGTRDGHDISNNNNNKSGLTEFDAFIMETTSQLAKSELDQYLEESLLPRVHEFDVVGWWKLNRMKYPTLSKMARDILTVPVSTVTGESVFSTVGPKEMDRYRCSLRPETVEALVCAKDWQQNESASNSITVSPIKMEVPI
ncbi:unnamed protein product [Cuscuta epithymum]|uniref:BED-type domain-containing protein n=1 Tax=Cuscuta epithymum TaxID=186058 RepID=A0AAV0CRV6_9ASTE|nr:unnamed protein product [Cuscuta epithymum]CAH9136124.1 unnamed protein product [Cuscuta epithymum]